MRRAKPTVHLWSGADDVRLKHGFERGDGPTLRQSVGGGSSARRPRGTRGPFSASPPAAAGAVDDGDDDNEARTAGRRPAGAEIPEAVGEIAPRESRPGVEEAATGASFFSRRSDRGRSGGPVFYLGTVPQARVRCACGDVRAGAEAPRSGRVTRGSCGGLCGEDRFAEAEDAGPVLRGDVEIITRNASVVVLPCYLCAVCPSLCPFVSACYLQT